MEYVQPQNIIAEKAVLSACMLEKNATSMALQYIGDRPEYFHDINHRAYWRAIIRLYKKGQQPDLILLSAECELEKETLLRPVRSDLAHISSTVASIANLQHHCLLLVQTFLKRLIMAKGRQLVSEAADGSSDVFSAIDKVQDLQAQISGTIERLTRKDPKAILLEYIDKSAAGEFEAQGIPYGFSEIDNDFYQGLSNGGLYVIAGRPKMGKTTLGLQIAMCAQDNNRKPGLISLELSAEELVENLLSYRTGIKKHTLQVARKPDGSTEKLAEAVDYFDSTSIAIVDSNMTNDILDIVSTIVNFVNNEGVKLIVIDYYQLIENRSKGKRYDGLVDISKTLTRLAKKLNVPILLLAQLGAHGEIEDCKQPQKDCRAMFTIERKAETPKQAIVTPMIARGIELPAFAYNMEVGECGILTMRGIPNFKQVSGVGNAYLPEPFVTAVYNERIETLEIQNYWEQNQQ